MLVEHTRMSESFDHVNIRDPLVFCARLHCFYCIFFNNHFKFAKSDVSGIYLAWDMVVRHNTMVDVRSFTSPAPAKFLEEKIFVNQYMARVVWNYCVILGRYVVHMGARNNYGQSDKSVYEYDKLLSNSPYARAEKDAGLCVLGKTLELTTCCVSGDQTFKNFEFDFLRGAHLALTVNLRDNDVKLVVEVP